jgi:hypothetical protein
MRRLTPAPGRGAVLAAGAVVLTSFAVLFDVRFAHQWDAGARLALFGVLAVLVCALAAQAPVEHDTPLPYHSTLQVAGIVLAGLALLNLADTLGADGQFGGAGEEVWTSLVLGVLALTWARRTNSAIMTLAAAALGVVALLSFVRWVADPKSVQTFRWFALLSAVCLTLGAVWLRDRARRHAVALADVAGLSIVFIGLSLALGAALTTTTSGTITSTSSTDGTTTTSTVEHVVNHAHPVGWEFILLAFGFGLIAYGAVDRERVPPFLGAVCVALFVIIAGVGFTSFVGWPLVLALIGVVLLAIGLRPRQELPPEPPVQP